MCGNYGNHHHWCRDCDAEAWTVIFWCLLVIVPCVSYLGYVFFTK